MRRAAGVLLLTILLLPVAAWAGGASPTAAGSRVRRAPGAGPQDRPLPDHPRRRGECEQSRRLPALRRACNAPVVLWVHGGGYHTGDKRARRRTRPRCSTARVGSSSASTTGSPTSGDPTSAHFPDHYDDVATAVAWVKAEHHALRRRPGAGRAARPLRRRRHRVERRRQSHLSRRRTASTLSALSLRRPARHRGIRQGDRHRHRGREAGLARRARQQPQLPHRDLGDATS